MTGIDLLREELMKRGCTASQTNAKVLPIVLDIVSNSNGKLTDSIEMLNEITEKVNHKKYILEEYKKQIRKLDEQSLQQIRLIEEQWKEYDEYINAFNKSLEECETAEGRDRLRLAQMYTNSVHVQTKYDQTAYIIGLASVISGGNVAPIKALRQINNKIPDPTIIKL